MLKALKKYLKSPVSSSGGQEKHVKTYKTNYLFYIYIYVYVYIYKHIKTYQNLYKTYKNLHKSYENTSKTYENL